MAVFFNENVVHGLSQTDRIQVGISDSDRAIHPEAGLLLPWTINPSVSWLDYQCWIETELDSGIVVHKILPQSIQNVDSLGGEVLNSAAHVSSKQGGPNLGSNGDYQDIKQRMATSCYRFCLKGWCRRAGYQPTIPYIKTIAGVEAVPDDEKPQKVIGPVLIANNSGVPIYYAAWALRYTTLVPPRRSQQPPDNLGQQASAATPLPAGIQPPLAPVDPDATAGQVRFSNDGPPARLGP